ncbi:phospho-N-acetylmuramoyl-pentapeptide-transferase [bacterium]|nr:phospho-N-acetylmuramoyl-pentapeptide-transferase [bacterium]
MFYHLLYPLRDALFVFNLFKYITFRIAGAAVTSLMICFIFGKPIIRWLRNKGVSSRIREDVPDRHLQKKGTPTMGGLIILLALIPSTLLWADLTNTYIWLTILATFWMGLMGIIDDYQKDFKGSNKGLMVKHKIISQMLLGLIIGAVLYFFPPVKDFRAYTEVPFFKHVLINLGIFYIPISAIVITASSNAINLTDGLDGLAIGLIAISTGSFAILSYIAGRSDFSEYLNLLYLPGSGELAIFCGALGGAALGFLWFNTHPAKIFMGDTGALSLGAALGVIAILLKKELVLLLVGGVFVCETLSVILQVFSFQVFGKRIFKMSPIHHHFELIGWKESQIVVRFWIVGILFSLLALSTLKMR